MKMIDLWKYEGKNIILIDDEGKEWRGYVTDVDDAIDNENGEDSINIRTYVDGEKRLIGFSRSEIKSIRLADEDKKN